MFKFSFDTWLRSNRSLHSKNGGISEFWVAILSLGTENSSFPIPNLISAKCIQIGNLG